MTWILFGTTAATIVVGGVFLARYGDVIGQKSGLGRSWIGIGLLAATTSLPELFTGFGATALTPLPNIAAGDIFGSCMFFLIGLTQRVLRKRFRVAWDTGAIAVVYAGAVWLVYRMHG